MDDPLRFYRSGGFPNPWTFPNGPWTTGSAANTTWHYGWTAQPQPEADVIIQPPPRPRQPLTTYERFLYQDVVLEEAVFSPKVP